MSNHDKHSHLVVGLVIGGVVGIGALSIFLAAKRCKEAPFSTIGQAILHFGEILQNSGLEEPAPIRHFEKKIHKHENSIDEVLSWVATGIHLWKHFKG